MDMPKMNRRRHQLLEFVICLMLAAVEYLNGSRKGALQIRQLGSNL
jgi:hypothetical protein